MQLLHACMHGRVRVSPLTPAHPNSYVAFGSRVRGSPNTTLEAPLITAVVNHKGGVGKTTTTLEVGTLLTRAGRRVLLVDLDPQSTLTLAAGYRPAQTAQMPTVYEVLRDGVDPATAILATAHGPSLLPAKIAMSQADLN